MADDLDVGTGFRPGFRQQPNSAPKPALVQQPPPPAYAVPDYADGPHWASPVVAALRRRCLGRGSEIAGSQFPVIGVLHPGSIGPGQQRGYRQHQPMAGAAGGVGPPGLMPLPAQTLDGLEAQFDPKRRAYQLTPTASGGWSVIMIHGSS